MESAQLMIGRGRYAFGERRRTTSPLLRGQAPGHRRAQGEGQSSVRGRSASGLGGVRGHLSTSDSVGRAQGASARRGALGEKAIELARNNARIVPRAGCSANGADSPNTSARVRNQPGRVPFVNGLTKLQQQSRVRTFHAAEPLFRTTMENFDRLVVTGVATQGDRQNGKGDFFNDVLALLLERCSGKNLHTRPNVPGSFSRPTCSMSRIRRWVGSNSPWRPRPLGFPNIPGARHKILLAAQARPILISA